MAAKPKRANGKATKGVDASQWRNRIVGHGEEDPEQLLANPKNWRIHPRNQQDALEGSLDEVGWIDEITVNRNTGFVVDGHARAAIAISRGEKAVPTRYVDLSEGEEALILAAKDPISAMAVPDSERLNELIGDIEVANPALDALLYSIIEDAERSTLRDEDGPKGGSMDQSGPKSAQIKPVLYADEIAVFESAIRMTGEPNRGRALIEICRGYLQQTKG